MNKTLPSPGLKRKPLRTLKRSHAVPCRPPYSRTARPELSLGPLGRAIPGPGVIEQKGGEGENGKHQMICESQDGKFALEQAQMLI